MSEERGAERVDGADDLSVDDNAPLQLPLQLPLGTSEHTVEHGGLNRSFTVYRPSFDQLTAVVLCLHELHSNATNACRDYCAPYAAELGFVAVCPQGTPPERWCAPYEFCRLDMSMESLVPIRQSLYPTELQRDLGRSPSAVLGWNSYDDPDKYYARWNADDVGFIKKTIGRVSAMLAPSPPRHTFALGHGMGGALAYRLSCELSYMIDAFGVTGMSWTAATAGRGDSTHLAHWRSGDGCAARSLDEPVWQPRPLWSGGGTADEWFPEKCERWLQPWTFRRLCAESLESGWHAYALDALQCKTQSKLVFRSRTSRAECQEYSNCSAPTRHCKYVNMPHTFPGSLEHSDINRISKAQADTVSTDAMESYLGELVGQEMPALVAAWAFWAESLGLEPPECADARHCFWRRQKRDDGLGWEFPPYVATEEEMAGFGNVSGKWGSHVPELEGHSVQTPLEALGQTPPEAEALPLGARVGALAGLGYGAAAGVGLFLAIGAAVVIAVPRRRQRTAPSAPCSAAAFSM